MNLRKKRRDESLTCSVCLKVFDQKSHFDQHTKRKTSCEGKKQYLTIPYPTVFKAPSSLLNCAYQFSYTPFPRIVIAIHLNRYDYVMCVTAPLPRAVSCIPFLFYEYSGFLRGMLLDSMPHLSHRVHVLLTRFSLDMDY